MIELDLRSRLPLYEQLVEKMKTLIITHTLKADEQLPSVRQLASQLTINPNTIQKAYRELENQGYIYALPGKGNFVTPLETKEHHGKLAEIEATLRTLMAEALFLGMEKEALIRMIDEAQTAVPPEHSQKGRE